MNPGGGAKIARRNRFPPAPGLVAGISIEFISGWTFRKVVGNFPISERIHKMVVIHTVLL